MKTKLIILICLACPLHLFAEKNQLFSDSASSAYRINSVFGRNSGEDKISWGFFIEFNAAYTRFSHNNVFLPGLSLGLIVDHHWTIGLMGSFIGNPHGLHYYNIYYDSSAQKMRGADLRGGYGGALLEYTLFPQSRLHVSFPLMIGGGYMFYSPMRYNNNSGSLPPKYYHDIISRDSFFVVEPGVKMEVNLASIFRIGFEISYRYSPDFKLKNTSADLINQFTARLSLRLGKF
jgi:hypothetical protein